MVFLSLALLALIAADLLLTIKGLRLGYDEGKTLASPFMRRFGPVRGLLAFTALEVAAVIGMAAFDQWALLAWLCLDHGAAVVGNIKLLRGN